MPAAALRQHLRVVTVQKLHTFLVAAIKHAEIYVDAETRAAWQIRVTASRATSSPVCSLLYRFLWLSCERRTISVCVTA
jgi:hypothetical protein